MKREDLCWSTGPRVGSEGHPYCLLPAGHDGTHIAHPESGFFARWGDPLCRANPDTIRAAWLPLGFLDRLNEGVPYPALAPAPDVPEPITATCTVCRTDIHWIDAPTGGWWAHDVHPEDEHDAQTTTEVITRDDNLGRTYTVGVLPKYEFDSVVDYTKVAESCEWLCHFREALPEFIRQLEAGGFAIVKRVPTDYIDAATRRAEAGPPAKVETTASPLVLEDLRRMVIDTAGWSPVTRVDLERRYTEAQPKVGETRLVVRRGKLAAHRKRDLGLTRS
ncbi:hypothetical protein [Nocardia farcinica]|uniref:hypothetical protein n=1 Tax=Nocardia farcinica TaxID=37329 RepID=UPI0024537E57|nr:hypothetical protein [Nocardia farcinica]